MARPLALMIAWQFFLNARHNLQQLSERLCSWKQRKNAAAMMMMRSSNFNHLRGLTWGRPKPFWPFAQNLRSWAIREYNLFFITGAISISIAWAGFCFGWHCQHKYKNTPFPATKVFWKIIIMKQMWKVSSHEHDCNPTPHVRSSGVRNLQYANAE